MKKCAHTKSWMTVCYHQLFYHVLCHVSYCLILSTKYVGGGDLKYMRKMSTLLFGRWLAKKIVRKCSMLGTRAQFFITEFCYKLYLSRLCCGHYGNMTFVLFTLVFPIYSVQCNVQYQMLISL